MLLDKELKELERLFDHYKDHNSAVSDREVGWHIDHSLKTIIVICDALMQSDPDNYRWRFNALRFLVYTRGSIPRGRGKSPKVVRNDGKISREDLITQWQTVKNKLELLQDLHPKSNVPHPYFGVLNLKQSRRFLTIHTRHHLKIIRDIMRAL